MDNQSQNTDAHLAAPQTGDVHGSTGRTATQRDAYSIVLQAWNESYPRMDIYSRPGTLVMFDALGGYDGEKKSALAVLAMRGLYEVASIEVGSFSSRVRLMGVTGSFNTVLFAEGPIATAIAPLPAPPYSAAAHAAAYPGY